MADNLTINTATGTATAATDDVAGVHFQRVKVVSGSDGGAADVATAALTSVGASITSVSLLAANADRAGATFYNESTSVLYLAYGATASATAYTVAIPASGYYELPAPAYTGAISGIWVAANGNARITEVGG